MCSVCHVEQEVLILLKHLLSAFSAPVTMPGVTAEVAKANNKEKTRDLRRVEGRIVRRWCPMKDGGQEREQVQDLPGRQRPSQTWGSQEGPPVCTWTGASQGFRLGSAQPEAGKEGGTQMG